ncbi:hypothetical protein PG995_015295 [Apiospora arundinis]
MKNATTVVVAERSLDPSLHVLAKGEDEDEKGSIITPTLLSSGLQVREASRAKTLITPTPGLAPGYLQANLIVLPSRYAADFRLLCARNPVPCPLIAESEAPGLYSSIKSCVAGLAAADLLSSGTVDLRHDIPRYMVYRDSELVRAGVLDIEDEWDGGDHVAFLVGCSYSFENALSLADLPPRHTVLGRNVPMYRTRLPLCPAGVATHGEPIAWGWDAVRSLGIRNIDSPEWGDAPVAADGRRPMSELQGSDEEVPVFWACGVTPQEAAMRANLKGTVMAHAPGHMLLLDCKDQDIVNMS